MATKKSGDLISDLKITRKDFENSADWFQQQVQHLIGKGTREQILAMKNRSTIYPVMGRMYLAQYDAKWKNTPNLPVWDSFPLFFPFSKNGNQMMGINLHFIPIPTRIMAINALLRFSNNPSMSATTRLVMQWDMIKALSTAKNLGLENCVKMYLMDHWRTPFVEVPPTSWSSVATLDLEHFNYYKK